MQDERQLHVTQERAAVIAGRPVHADADVGSRARCFVPARHWDTGMHGASFELLAAAVGRNSILARGPYGQAAQLSLLIEAKRLPIVRCGNLGN
jgi:hypothetical protein